MMKSKDYIKAMEHVQLPPEAQNRILLKIKTTKTKERFNKMSKKKIGVLAAAAALVLGITVFAANGIIAQWYGSSSSIPDYRSLPTAEQCIKDAGYAPCLLEQFENGYAFENGSVVDNALQDENGKDVETFQSFSFRYVKDGDTVIFSQEQYDSDMETFGDVIASDNGTDLYYFGYTNKLVPPDYQLTDEDKRAEANGELVFSYGSDQVSISKVQSVSWSIGNMHYSLTQIDGKLSADDLVQMAKELLAQSR